MHSLFTRFVLSVGNVLFSLVLGALALGITLFYFPDRMLQLLTGARNLLDLMAGAWSPQYEVLLRFFIEERTIVFVGFVLVTRILVGLIIMLAYKLMGRRPEPEYPM